MTGHKEEMMEQAGGAVATGGQGPAEKNNDGEPEVAVSAACAPKAAAAVPASLPRHRRSKRSVSACCCRQPILFFSLPTLLRLP